MKIQEWNKLSRQEKREAILNFKEPENLHQPIINIKEDKE